MIISWVYEFNESRAFSNSAAEYVYCASFVEMESQNWLVWLGFHSTWNRQRVVREFIQRWVYSGGVCTFESMVLMKVFEVSLRESWAIEFYFVWELWIFREKIHCLMSNWQLGVGFWRIMKRPFQNGTFHYWIGQSVLSRMESFKIG